MYNNIIDPDTGHSVFLHTQKGKALLKHYIQNLHGGSKAKSSRSPTGKSNRAWDQWMSDHSSAISSTSKEHPLHLLFSQSQSVSLNDLSVGKKYRNQGLLDYFASTFLDMKYKDLIVNGYVYTDKFIHQNSSTIYGFYTKAKTTRKVLPGTLFNYILPQSVEESLLARIQESEDLIPIGQFTVKEILNRKLVVPVLHKDLMNRTKMQLQSVCENIETVRRKNLPSTQQYKLWTPNRSVPKNADGSVSKNDPSYTCSKLYGYKNCSTDGETLAQTTARLGNQYCTPEKATEGQEACEALVHDHKVCQYTPESKGFFYTSKATCKPKPSQLTKLVHECNVKQQKCERNMACGTRQHPDNPLPNYLRAFKHSLFPKVHNPAPVCCARSTKAVLKSGVHVFNIRELIPFKMTTSEYREMLNRTLLSDSHKAYMMNQYEEGQKDLSEYIENENISFKLKGEKMVFMRIIKILKDSMQQVMVSFVKNIKKMFNMKSSSERLRQSVFGKIFGGMAGILSKSGKWLVNFMNKIAAAGVEFHEFIMQHPFYSIFLIMTAKYIKQVVCQKFQNVVSGVEENYIIQNAYDYFINKKTRKREKISIRFKRYLQKNNIRNISQFSNNMYATVEGQLQKLTAFLPSTAGNLDSLFDIIPLGIKEFFEGSIFKDMYTTITGYFSAVFTSICSTFMMGITNYFMPLIKATLEIAFFTTAVFIDTRFQFLYKILFTMFLLDQIDDIFFADCNLIYEPNFTRPLDGSIPSDIEFERDMDWLKSKTTFTLEQQTDKAYREDLKQKLRKLKAKYHPDKYSIEKKIIVQNYSQELNDIANHINNEIKEYNKKYTYESKPKPKYDNLREGPYPLNEHALSITNLPKKLQNEDDVNKLTSIFTNKLQKIDKEDLLKYKNGFINQINLGLYNADPRLKQQLLKNINNFAEQRLSAEKLESFQNMMEDQIWNKREGERIAREKAEQERKNQYVRSVPSNEEFKKDLDWVTTKLKEVKNPKSRSIFTAENRKKLKGELRKLRTKYHPDKFPEEEAKEKVKILMQELNEKAMGLDDIIKKNN